MEWCDDWQQLVVVCGAQVCICMCVCVWLRRREGRVGLRRGFLSSFRISTYRVIVVKRFVRDGEGVGRCVYVMVCIDKSSARISREREKRKKRKEKKRKEKKRKRRGGNKGPRVIDAERQ